jgi:hypothetical protein
MMVILHIHTVSWNGVNEVNILVTSLYPAMLFNPPGSGFPLGHPTIMDANDFPNKGVHVTYAHMKDFVGNLVNKTNGEKCFKHTDL